MAYRAVRNDLGDIDAATLWADSELGRCGIERAQRNAVGVCIEEALTNLVRHGRAARHDKAIGIAVEVDRSTVTVVISDACVPYDAACAALPDRPGPGAIRDGGHGLRLLHGLATDLCYAIAEGRNTLTLTFVDPGGRVDP